MRTKKGLIKSAFKTLEINANALEEGFDCWSCVVGLDECLRPAISNELAAINSVFIAFGVATKVVVVIQNQNLFVRPVCLSIEKSGGKAAQPGPHDHEVIGFCRINDRASTEIILPCAGVRLRIRAGMITPESR